MRSALTEAASRELSTNPRATVVDLGCGERPYEPIFKQFNARYIGVDIIGNNQADITIALGDSVPLADNFADVVVSNQVLEHVIDVSAYLAECLRLLKVGGALILSTHGCWTYHPYPVDVRRWTCWGLRHDIEAGGFRVEDAKGCVGPLAYTTQLRLQLLRGFLVPLGRFTLPIVSMVSWWSQVLMRIEDGITPQAIKQDNSAIYVVTARKPATNVAADEQ